MAHGHAVYTSSQWNLSVVTPLCCGCSFPRLRGASAKAADPRPSRRTNLSVLAVNSSGNFPWSGDRLESTLRAWEATRREATC